MEAYLDVKTFHRAGILKEEGLELSDDRYCFVCGEKNPVGLKLKFSLKDNVLTTRFRPGKEYQGFTNIVHGGIIGLVLDEMIANLPWMLGIPAVTAEYNVRLKKPAIVNEELEFNSRIVGQKGRLILVEAGARKEDGTSVAVATGKCIRVEKG